MALHQPVDLCHEFPLAGCRVRFFADTEFSPNAGLLQEARAAVVDLRGSEGLSCAWPAPANAFAEAQATRKLQMTTATNTIHRKSRSNLPIRSLPSQSRRYLRTG
jgi:hypothetical protein